MIRSIRSCAGRLFLVACFVSVDLTLVMAQEKPQPSRYGGEVEVTVVNLDVRVRDKGDRPVSGLKVGSFEVFENGQAIPISHFYEVKAPAQIPADARPGPVRTESTNDKTGGETRLAVFVDDENIHPTRRNLALDSLTEFLTREMSPSTHVTVLRSSQGLKWVLDDSTDSDEIRAALAGLRSGTGGSVFRDSDFRSLVLDIQNASSFTEARAVVRQYARQRHIEAMATFNAVAAAISVLSGESGRTMLLYVGDGFPVEPGGEAFQLLDDAYAGRGVLTEATEYQLRPALNTLIEQANAVGVMFSAYDAKGLDVGSSAGTDGPVGMGGAAGFRIDSLRRSSRQAPLAALTSETGGSFERSGNSISSLLNTVEDDLRSYYSIGFESRVSGPGEDRSIKVHVKGDGLKVRHKSSFTPRSVEDQRADDTLAALFLAPRSNPLELGVRILDPQKAGRRRYNLPIDVLIPMHRLVTMPSSSGSKFSLELLFASCDERGTTSPVQRIYVEGTQPATSGDKVPVLRHQVTLQLKPGEHRIAVTAHDLIGGATTSISGSLTVP